MNLKQRYIKITTRTLFAAVLLFGSSAAFAQVKIGSNPTVINPANNLEVEASTTGRKTSVDKTTGQVTIADGTEGVGKILTSDVSGGASWQAVTSAMKSPKMRLSGGTTPNFSFNFQMQELNYSSTDFSEAGMVRVGNGIKVPVDGYYQINAMGGYQNFSGCTDPAAWLAGGVYVFVNGTITNSFFTGKELPRTPGSFTNSITDLIKLNADDVVTTKANFSINYNPAGCDTKIFAGNLSLTYVP